MANWRCEKCGHEFSWGRPRSKRFEYCTNCHTDAVMPIYVNGKPMVPDTSETPFTETETGAKLGKKKGE